MDQKLSLVETSEVMIDFINHETSKTKAELNARMDRDGKEVHDRFEKLILEELTHEEGFFGKEGSIIRPFNPEDQQEGQESEEGF